MKIRTSLRLTSTVSIFMMVAALAGSALAFMWLEKASAFEVQLIQLQGNIFERTQLRDEFILLYSPQALHRWGEKSQEVEQNLKGLSRRPLSPSAAALLEGMKQKYTATRALMARMVENRGSMGDRGAGNKEAARLEQRLVSQLLLEAYLFSDSTKLLLLDARRDTTHARNQLLLLLIVLTMTLGLVVTSATGYLNRLTSKRVLALKTWAGHLAQGSFDYRLQVKGNDELAELAHEVNDLADKLQASYQSLESANHELTAFTYSVSHDLRAPLRHITGFVEMLQKRDLSQLDTTSLHYLEVISGSARKMGCLIDDLLSFSRMSRSDMMKRTVSLDLLTREVIEEITQDQPEDRPIDWRIGPLPMVVGDQAMLRLALTNLLSNAVKYSRKVATPVIEIKSHTDEHRHHVVAIKDNGAGFDMRFVDKLFGLFQRLHTSEEYDGTGVGLANVRRIVARHGGRTWAEGEINKGATFYFTLPQGPEG